jgi:hypothetical protein
MPLFGLFLPIRDALRPTRQVSQMSSFSQNDDWLGLATKIKNLRYNEGEYFFWRIERIESLVGYPEKTDRLEQRQRRGQS